MKIKLSNHSIRVRISQLEKTKLVTGESITESFPLGKDTLIVAVNPKPIQSPKIEFRSTNHWSITLPVGKSEFQQCIELDSGSIDFKLEVDLYKK